MTGTRNGQVTRAMQELNVAPESVADAVVCRSGEVVLVLNSSRIVSWSPPPAGVNWPVRPSSAGPLGDGGRVGPPRCEEERLIESRRWRVKVLEAGVGPWPFPTEMAEEVARTLAGTPVCMREDFAHESIRASSRPAGSVQRHPFFETPKRTTRIAGPSTVSAPSPSTSRAARDGGAGTRGGVSAGARGLEPTTARAG